MRPRSSARRGTVCASWPATSAHPRRVIADARGAALPSETLVLVVDDEPKLRGFLRRVLEDEGYLVETASDGCEALTKARACSPHAILLDLLMPVLDGVGFLRECRASPTWSSVPILVMSAGDTRIHAETLGAHAVLPKPFDLDILLSKLASVL